MPLSANREGLLAAVEQELHALETVCAQLERALMRRNWADMDAAIAESRRITHALQNAMADSADVRDETFDEGVTRRLHYVHAVRENQMTRLQQFHDAVGERLQLMARWKSALRSIGKGEKTPSLLGSLDRLS